MTGIQTTYRRLVVKHLVARGVLAPEAATVHERWLMTTEGNVLKLLASLKAEPEDILAAAATAAGLPVAPGYILGSPAFSAVTKEQALVLKAIPVEGCLEGLVVVFSDPEVALAPNDLPEHVAFLGWPVSVEAMLHDVSIPGRGEVTVPAGSFEPAPVSSLHPPTAVPVPEPPTTRLPIPDELSVLEPKPTIRVSAPAEIDSLFPSGGGGPARDPGFSERTLAQLTGAPVSEDVAEQLEAAEAEAQWIALGSSEFESLEGDPEHPDPFAGDTVIETQTTPLRSDESSAHNVLERATASELPTMGIRRPVQSSVSDPFLPSEDEIASWDPEGSSPNPRSDK